MLPLYFLPSSVILPDTLLGPQVPTQKNKKEKYEVRQKGLFLSHTHTFPIVYPPRALLQAKIPGLDDAGARERDSMSDGVRGARGRGDWPFRFCSGGRTLLQMFLL